MLPAGSATLAQSPLADLWRDLKDPANRNKCPLCARFPALSLSTASCHFRLLAEDRDKRIPGTSSVHPALRAQAREDTQAGLYEQVTSKATDVFPLSIPSAPPLPLKPGTCRGCRRGAVNKEPKPVLFFWKASFAKYFVDCRYAGGPLYPRMPTEAECVLCFFVLCFVNISLLQLLPASLSSFPISMRTVP